MQARNEISHLFDQMDSKFFKALAEPGRLEILKTLILLREADIHTIAKDLPQDRSVISRHLSILEEANVVSVRKEGRHRFYSLRSDQFIDRFEGILASIKQCIALDCC